MTDAGRLSRRGSWVFAVSATVVSTYLLDAVATATGALLAASHVLRGVDHRLLLVFLVCTYGLWIAGLRVSVRANWTLLEQTGTSTNALSKAAYDLARLRSARRRTQQVAATVGYAATELAKEIPYYAGAFGAAVVSDSVSSGDALIFLGGTNIGAAGYEYGLARATRLYLRRRSRPV
jgi:hypothetical protein